MLVALTSTGCSDESPERGAGTTAEVTSSTVADAGAATADESTTTVAGASATTAAPAPTDAPPPTALEPVSSGLPEVLSENSRGEKIRLDETALLACANNQIAWVALQQDDVAEADRVLAIAAERARTSAVPEISSAADALLAASEGDRRAGTVDDFLEVCVERGFEY